MINSLFESSNWDRSNGSKIIMIASISKIISLLEDLDVLLRISVSSNWILIIFVPFDSPYQEDLNDVWSITLALILTKLLRFKVFTNLIKKIFLSNKAH